MTVDLNKNLEIFRKKKCIFCKQNTCRKTDTVNLAGELEFVFCDKCDLKLSVEEKSVILLSKAFNNHKDKTPESVIELICNERRSQKF